MADNANTGYKRPPRGTQFKAGRSGNPRGRPKGSNNLKTDLTKLLKRRITVREDGEVRKITRQEAILLGLFSKAVHGDVKAISQIFAMCMKFDPPHAVRDEVEDVAAIDDEIIEEFLRSSAEERKKEEGHE